MFQRLLLTLLILLIAAAVIVLLASIGHRQPSGDGSPHSTSVLDRQPLDPLTPELQRELDAQNADSPPEPPEVWNYDEPPKRREVPEPSSEEPL